MTGVNYDDTVKRLVEARQAKKISQRKMAELLGVTPQFLSMIENLSRRTTHDTLCQYAEEVGLRLELDLVGRVGLVTVEIPAEAAEAVAALNDLPADLYPAMAEIIRSLPDAPPRLRAGILSAIRSLAAAASSPATA